MAEVDLTAVAVYGLENLHNKKLQVDQEANLLEGLTIAEGLTLHKVEIEADGIRTEVFAPETFIPEYPGDIYLVFTFSKPDGSTLEATSGRLKVAPLDSKAPALAVVDIIAEKYSWYNKLYEETRDFIKPRILLSYYVLNRYTKGDRLHIILWETYEGLENIWEGGADTWIHAEEAKSRIMRLCPETDIKSCAHTQPEEWWSLGYLSNYIKQYPEISFVISCAAKEILKYNRNDLDESRYVASLRDILNNPNVAFVTSNNNKTVSGKHRISYNENIKTWNFYGSGAPNGDQDNHFLSTSRNIGSNTNYFSPQHGVWLKWYLPEWFDGPWCTTHVYMTAFITRGGNPDYDTSCSYSAATFAADLWNAIDAIKLNRPNTTQAEAARIVKNEFLQTEVMKIKDPDTGELVERIKDPFSGEMVGGGHISTIDERKLIDHEVWQKDKLNLIQFNAEDVPLPMMPWICYEGMGVYFKVHGVIYANTISNQTILEQALVAGEIEGWWRSRTLWKKQGGKDTAELKVRSVDTQARLFLKDHYLTVTKPVLTE